MFTIIGIMLTGMLLGYLLRSKRLTWIHKVITLLIWLLLFLLGIDAEKLHAIMHGIHAQCVKYGTEPDGYINYVKGANIAGFMKVAHAMMGQGVI